VSPRFLVLDEIIAKAAPLARLRDAALRAMKKP
jgi:hypothetical protein